jgi:4-amino-4-deoxy-L-arabinose transferase-like glycosyltransferase
MTRAARAWRSPACIFLVALGVRLIAIALLGTARAAEGEHPWNFGHEAACLAESLRHGESFGDPWGKGTGPSSWLTPVYPGLVAVCLEAGGGVGARAAWCLFSAQALGSAFAAILTGRLARVLDGERAGVLAAWLFALHPLAIWYAVGTVWDTSFVALALVGVAALALEAPRPWSDRRTLLLGFASGSMVFLNPATVAALPGMLLVGGRGATARGAMRRLALFALAAILPCVPWMVRNVRVLGSPGLRTNFGVELRVGNLGAGGGRNDTTLHPSHSEVELARYREMGEVGYSRWARMQTLAWIAEHPASFAGLCARRAAQFWIGELPFFDARVEGAEVAASDPRSWMKWVYSLGSGLACWLVLARHRRDVGARAIAAILVLFCVPYVLTHVSERYRFPIEPLIVATIAWGIAARSVGSRTAGTVPGTFPPPRL